jgi:hypothetical protein
VFDLVEAFFELEDERDLRKIMVRSAPKLPRVPRANRPRNCSSTQHGARPEKHREHDRHDLRAYAGRAAQ